MTDGWDISCEIVLREMLLDLTDDKSTLVQVMAWCRQASSHYLSQCWSRSVSAKIASILLTHWGRVTHIFVGNLTSLGPDNGLSPGRHQSIIWSDAGILLIGPLGTNFSEILIDIHTFSFTKMHLKMSAKWHPFCLSLNVLRSQSVRHHGTWPTLV